MDCKKEKVVWNDEEVTDKGFGLECQIIHIHFYFISQVDDDESGKNIEGYHRIQQRKSYSNVKSGFEEYLILG